MRRFLSLLFLIIFLIPYQGISQTDITKDSYLQAAKSAWLKWYGPFEKSLKEAENGSVALVPNSHYARTPGMLYAVTGEKNYSEMAKQVLTHMSKSDNYYTYTVLNQIVKSGVLTDRDRDYINKRMLEEAEYTLKYWPEWGAMNHCSNHIINGLTVMLRYMPGHPDAEKWRQKRDVNLSGNWGKWSIEDSHIYIPVWLQPLMQYAEMEGREREFYAMPTVKYYFDYLVQLVTPGGQVAEFGDGRYGKGYTWDWMIAVLEKGAAVYRDGKMKWAAHRIFQAHVQEMGHENFTELIDAYRWADDTVPEEIPADKSRLVLEDYVGKKVVFRSGWDRNATYLFLNFLDDPAFGVDGKEHMINTINVEAEKNHHGHADENAINMMMKNGSVLLYDGGYRETSSTGPDGQWRADVFHNRLVVRDGAANPDFRLMPFLMDGGQYKFVTTKLMHFRRFRDVDISRTRVTGQHRQYQWDRLIQYVKGDEYFIITDFVKILKGGVYTLANLFYTENITGYDVDNPVWFDTEYRTIAGHVLNADTRLLIYFPEGNAFRMGAEELRRNLQRETAIYTARADSFKRGEMVIFTTFLIPHDKSVMPDKIIGRFAEIKIFNAGNGYGISVPSAEGVKQFNAMIDLEAEYLKANVRPRYNFESGRAVYGSLETDARYCYLNIRKDTVFYSFLKASRLNYKGKTVFQANSLLHGQDNGVYRKTGIPKWVAWEDTFSLKNSK